MTRRYYMYETQIDSDGYMELDKDGVPIIYRICIITSRELPTPPYYPVSSDQWLEDRKKQEQIIPAKRMEIKKEEVKDDISEREGNDPVVRHKTRAASRPTKQKRAAVRSNNKNNKNVSRRGNK